MQKLIFILLISLFAHPVFAETILLKSGETLEAKIIEKTNTYIKVDVAGMSLTYFLNDIRSIAGMKPELFKLSGVDGSAAPIEKTVLNKADIINKMLQAEGNIARISSRKTEEMRIKQLMRIKKEQVVDIDFDARIFHSMTKVLEYELYYRDLSRAYFEKKILEAKQKGASAEKIKELEMAIDEATRAGQEELKRVIEKTQKEKLEVYFTEKPAYVGIQDEWVQLELTDAGLIKELVSKARLGEIDQGLERRLAHASSVFIRSLLQPFIAAIKYSDIYKDLNSISVSEEAYLKKPCYVLDIKIKDVMNMMKEKILAYSQIEAGPGAKISLGNFSYKDFISPQTYLRLGTQFDCEIYFSSPEYEQPIMSILKVKIDYTYPDISIALPKDLSRKISVKNEEQLSQMIRKNLEERSRE